MSNTPHIAITGAAGFIGSRLVGDLRRKHPDWDITALDNFYLGEVREIEDIEVKHVDIRHRDQLENLLADADVIVHLAAISGVDDCDEQPDLAYETNVIGTNNVAYICQKTGAAMVFPFSMAVIGDPTEFPITSDMARDPLNWYGKTKVLGEAVVDAMAEESFPAYQFMIANLYGEHVVGERTVSKGTVINFFIQRALAGEPLTVYEPGSQSRNFIHVLDVADALRRGTERLLQLRDRGETGARTFELAGDEDPGVMAVAETVAEVAREERGVEVEIDLVENPRSGETLVDEFGVDTSAIHEELDWRAQQSIEESVRDLLQ